MEGKGSGHETKSVRYDEGVAVRGGGDTHTHTEMDKMTLRRMSSQMPRPTQPERTLH